MLLVRQYPGQHDALSLPDAENGGKGWEVTHQLMRLFVPGASTLLIGESRSGSVHPLVDRRTRLEEKNKSSGRKEPVEITDTLELE